MSTFGKRILLVALDAGGVLAAVERLECRGWECRVVESLREAEEALETGNFRIVLAAEEMADGSGFDLRDTVIKRAGSLFVAILLSESCLWLPVAERGVRTLGECALDPHTLEEEIEGLLSERRNRAGAKRLTGHPNGASTRRTALVGQMERRSGELGVGLGQG
jgi:DNA-binding NtrC family response regulator